jgi:hypothetical protein
VTIGESPFSEGLREAGADLNRLVTRLGALSGTAWTPRREPVLYLLNRLAVLCASAEGLKPHAVPELDSYALADATSVLGGDVLMALNQVQDADVLSAVTSAVLAALQETR